MKKYKLIKEYPGCNISLGETVTDHLNCKTLYNNGANSFDKGEVEDYPEYWEEVKEIPEYVKCTKEEGSNYVVGVFYEVSPAGRIYYKELSEKYWAYWQYNQHRFVPATKEEYDAQFKPVLFVTEDGVEIREGDNFWATYNYDIILDIPHKCTATSSFSKVNWTNLFSTKEAAEKYIDMNKPIYSKKQAIQMLHSLDSDLTIKNSPKPMYKDYLL